MHLFQQINTPNQVKMRLFYFPFAGGTANSFRKWQNSFDESIEVHALQLPGRGTSIDKKPYRYMHDLLDDLAWDIRDNLDIPYIFLGHSLGARIAYGLSQRLHKDNKPLPVHFIASASRAPHLLGKNHEIWKSSDFEFIQALKKIGGTPNEILSDAELMKSYLPSIRADFSLASQHTTNLTKLNIKANIIKPLQDTVVESSEMNAWESCFSSPPIITQCDGNHFYIENDITPVLEIINSL